MQSYVAILRGINVSGQKKIRMDDLRKILGECGFKDLQTYIQSGNIVFQSEETNKRILASLITDTIRKHYDFEVPVILKNASEIEDVLINNPFLIDGREVDQKRLYVTFLEDKPAQEKIDTLDPESYNPDEFIFRGSEIYLFVPVGYGKTKLSNNFFENILQMTATTRNWNTVAKLADMSKQLY